jgi:hypothetical protein
MKNLNEIETSNIMSKGEIMSQIHELSLQGIKLIAKNENVDLEFEQYFLSMLELQTRSSSEIIGN